MRAPFVVIAKNWGPFSCFSEAGALAEIEGFLESELDSGRENASSVAQLDPVLYEWVELCEGPDPDDSDQACLCRRKHQADRNTPGFYSPNILSFRKKHPLTVEVTSPPEDYYLYLVEVRRR